MKGAALPPEVAAARGSLLYLKGRPRSRPVIDAISSWWVTASGHNHPRIVKAVQKQARALDQVLFANFSHPPARELARQLTSLLPQELSCLFFSDNGSTAVECGLKMALQSWQQKKQAQRTKFLSFTHSYHGDTTGAMSLSGPSVFNRPYKKMMFSVLRARQGTRPSDPISSYIDDFAKQLKKHHHQCAGVLIEPLVQGAGGMILWPPQAVKEISSLTKKYGVYLIFDEVMTGFGRTGQMFAFQKTGITPDILCLSKGLTGGFLPLGLTVTNHTVYDSFLSSKKEEMFLHGHSFTGNPLACAAAAAHIQILKQKSTPKNWKRIEAFHQKEISQIKNHPACRNTGVCGTIARMEFRSKTTGYTSRFAEQFTQKGLKQGVFLRPLGNIVYILPPYCISNQELQKVWNFIKTQLRQHTA